jgi:tRNA/tmRNA/rRNA uracil-C5-methylase (TrmA/RlmC/RlmD family)
VKLKEYLYISCNEKTAIRDLKDKNYKKIREFNLFPGTGYTEIVFLIYQ